MIAEGDGGAALFSLLFVVLAIGAYCLPTIVAVSRKTRNTAQVVIVNLLLGWSMIGWVVALVMAFSPDKKETGVV